MKNKQTVTQYRTCPICFDNQALYLITVNQIRILRCKQCSMVFADIDEITIEKACKYESGTILHYYQDEPIYTIAYYDKIIDNMVRIFGRTDLKILEFGCGSGMFLRRARKRGLITYGVDFSEYSIYAAKAFDLNIINSTIDDCHFPTNYFDVVFSHATFEHLYNPLKIAKELVRILKGGGLFLTSGVPNYNTFSIKLFHNFYNNNPPGHVNYFEVKSITCLYQALGLEKIDISTYGINIWFLVYQAYRQNNTISSKKKIESNEEIMHWL
ncbi:MAG TPA: class I SAM-dependent methyltransferase, partial [Thioploca sp.]|nr:class I SAM-dependent methyltransferase [Thioploca sp.]